MQMQMHFMCCIQRDIIPQKTHSYEYAVSTMSEGYTRSEATSLEKCEKNDLRPRVSGRRKARIKENSRN